MGGSDPCGQKGLKNCDTFDPVTKEWTSCAPLNISECFVHSSSFGVVLQMVLVLKSVCMFAQGGTRQLFAGWMVICM